MSENKPGAAVNAADEALRRSQQRYSAFIRNSSEAIWCFELKEPVSVALPPGEQIDAFYRLSYLAECNDAMARMYGYERPEELVGLALDQLMPRADPANVQYLEAFIAAGHQLVDAESVELTRDGKKKYLLNSLQAVIEHGAILRAWGTSRDVTVRREAEEARQRYINVIERLNETLENRVQQRTAELAEANEHLRAFAHTVAHDLRGPTRSVREYAALLLEDYSAQLAGEPLGFVQRIKRAGERMDALISSVLDYSRTLSADLEIELVATSEVVAEVIERHRDAIVRARAEIEVAADLPVVLAHRGLLLQALENIFTNALKFVPADRPPRIAFSASVQAGRARLHVRDNGVGVAEADRERIFGVFERAGRPENFAGTGIGLAIVKAALERMRGRVGVEAAPGGGSVFWVELPIPAGAS